MSGPLGEDARVYTRVALGVAMWPLALWSEQATAALTCAACNDVAIVTAAGARLPLSLAELALSIETHLERCRAVRMCDG